MKIPEKLVDKDYRNFFSAIAKVIQNQNIIIDCLHDIEAHLPKPEAPKRWRAIACEQYWVVESDGHIIKDQELDMTEDTFRYNTGNYFKTEAEAIAYREQLLTNGAQV